MGKTLGEVEAGLAGKSAVTSGSISSRPEVGKHVYNYICTHMFKYIHIFISTYACNYMYLCAYLYECMENQPLHRVAPAVDQKLVSMYMIIYVHICSNIYIYL
jgi:hypothetical protein